jgi:hypothetical protein
MVLVLGASWYGCSSEDQSPAGPKYGSPSEQFIAEYGAQVDPALVDRVIELAGTNFVQWRMAAVKATVEALKQAVTARGLDASSLDQVEDFTLGNSLPGVENYGMPTKADGIGSQSSKLSDNNPNLQYFECPPLTLKGDPSCAGIVDTVMAQIRTRANQDAITQTVKDLMANDPMLKNASQEFRDYATNYMVNVGLSVYTFGSEVAGIRGEYTLRNAGVCDNKLLNGTDIATLRGIVEGELILRNLVGLAPLYIAPAGEDCKKIGAYGSDADDKIKAAIKDFVAKNPMCLDLSKDNPGTISVEKYRRGGIDRAIKALITTITVGTWRDTPGPPNTVVAVLDGCNPRDQIRLTHSPLVIDLDGDGLDLTTDRVGFDLRATGESQKVTWAGRNEGFLALDLDHDGRITSGRELFGNASLCFGGRCADGAAALAIYDNPARGGNSDGRIDPADAIFDQLKVWVDRNQDGRSQPEELHSLADHGIRSISLQVNPMDQKVPAGRISLSLGVQTHHGPRTVYDVWFNDLTSPGFLTPLN